MHYPLKNKTVTVLALNRIFPELRAWRIIRGLVKMHFISMFQQTMGVWVCYLVIQSTYGGTDLTLSFDWLKDCSKSINSTWSGGFDWSGC